MKILLIAHGTCRFIQIQYNMGIVLRNFFVSYDLGQLAKSMCLFLSFIIKKYNIFLKARTSMYGLCLFHFAKNCALLT